MGEEAGRIHMRHRWAIDPLEGSTNFVMGSRHSAHPTYNIHTISTAVMTFYCK